MAKRPICMAALYSTPGVCTCPRCVPAFYAEPDAVAFKGFEDVRKAIDDDARRPTVVFREL